MCIQKFSRKLMGFMLVCVLAIVAILVTGSSAIDRDMAKTMAFAAEFGHTSKVPVLLAKDSMVSGKSIQGSQGSNLGQSTGQNQNSGAGHWWQRWCQWHPRQCAYGAAPQKQF